MNPSQEAPAEAVQAEQMQVHLAAPSGEHGQAHKPLSVGEHTPGPWQYAHRQKPDGWYDTQVFCAKGETIATLAWYPMPKTAEGVTASYREANARRIVQCVNACEGLYSDAFDGGWTAKGLSAYAKRLEDALSELAQAASVLERDYIDRWGENANTLRIHNAGAAARAALRKARGESE